MSENHDRVIAQFLDYCVPTIADLQCLNEDGVSQLYDAFIRQYMSEVRLFLFGGDNIEYHTLFLRVKRDSEEVFASVDREQFVLSESSDEESQAILLILKNHLHLDHDVSIRSQLSLLTLSDRTVTDTLASVINNGVSSIIDMLIQKSPPPSSLESLRLTKSKLQNLSLSLQNFKEKIPTPDLLALTHSTIANIVGEGANGDNYMDFLDTKELQDSKFLNELQKLANQWLKMVRNLCEIETDIRDGSASDEVQFWRNLQDPLISVAQQLKSPEIQISLLILSANRKWLNLLGFMSDSGLSQKLATVQDCRNFTSSIPLKELHLSENLQDIFKVIELTSAALKRFRFTNYPLDRFVHLFEKVSNDIQEKLLQVTPNLFLASNEDFALYETGISHMLSKWNDTTLENKIQLREVIRKRGIREALLLQIKSPTTKLEEALKDLSCFREQHASFRASLNSIGYEGYLDDLKFVMEPISRLDNRHLCDWTEAQEIHNQRLLVLESKLIKIWEEALTRSSNSEEMIDHYTKFAPLMGSHPRIRAVMSGCQKVLLNMVKLEISYLDKKINCKAKAEEVLAFKGLPPITSAITESLQIENRVGVLRRRCEVLLGAGWKELSEGRNLCSRFNEILHKTNSKSIFATWNSSAFDRTLMVLERPMLKVIINQNGTYELSVNFDYTTGTIFKEVRNLIYMGYEISTSVTRSVIQYKSLYSRSIVFLEQLQTFMSIAHELVSRIYTGVLLKHDVDNVWKLINKATITSWSNLAVDENIQRNDGIRGDLISSLENAVSVFLANFQKLEESEIRLTNTLNVLSKAPYSLQQFSEGIKAIQTVISKLVFSEFQGVDAVVYRLNKLIKKILLSKVQQKLSTMDLQKQRVLITFETNLVRVSPDLGKIKSKWVQEVEDITMEAALLPRIATKEAELNKMPCRDILNNLGQTICSKFSNIEKLYQRANDYFKQWKETEMLWNLRESDLYKHIGQDAKVCYFLVNVLIEKRSTLENLQNKSSFGSSLQFEFDESYSAIFRKLDYWRMFLCDLLLKLYLNESTSLCQEMKIDLRQLEESSLETCSLANFASLIETLQRTKSRQASRSELLKLLTLCCKVFIKVHLKLPSDFIYIDQIENDYWTLKDFMEKTEKLITDNRTCIIERLDAELRVIKGLSNDIMKNWQEQKSACDDRIPKETLDSIRVFQNAVLEIERRAQSVYECSKALVHPITVQNNLKNLSDELKEFEIVWNSLEDICNLTESLMQKEWKTLDSSELSRKPAELLAKTEKLSVKLPQSKCYQNLLVSLQDLVDSRGMLERMMNSPMKARHWRMIFEKSLQAIPPTLTGDSLRFSLKEVLALKLKTNEKLVKRVLQDAQTEDVLDKSLNKMKEFWKHVRYNTSRHQSGIELVQDWSLLQQSCLEDLDELVSMKHSVCYKYLEQDCLELESKLTSFADVQLDWIEVQFLWLDLYGIIGKNGQLSSLLPLESSKYHKVTSDFEVITLKIFRLSSVIDAVHVPGSRTVFKKMLETLKMIKSSLTDFLERQRKIFPRFFFLGNDDLLKLLGNADDLGQMSRYMQKMFGSIRELQTAGNNITGVISVEGEILTLKDPIIFEPTLRPDQWLRMLEFEIRKTLAEQTILSLKSISEGWQLSNLLDSHVFQTLLLSWQIFWTMQVDHVKEERNFSELLATIEQEISKLLHELNCSQEATKKRKIRSLLVECIHSSTVVSRLCKLNSAREVDLLWNNTQKIYYKADEPDVLNRIYAVQSGRTLNYGFFYIGVPERLIYTSTLETGFAALTEALSLKFGGCLFGPAGTGKTETIKALGQNLGRMVLVFNCDDSFDFQAMSRLILGIAQVGAWGCFDELNRLDENILSSVTGHVGKIQIALSQGDDKVNVMGDTIPLDKNSGLFITLNPGYCGRSTLPEILKKQFREFSMNKAEKRHISEVMLKIMGFQNAKGLARKIVLLFEILERECSRRKHYDFGLRSVKKVLRNCLVLITLGNYSGEDALMHSVSQIILPTLSKSDEKIYKAGAARVFNRNDPAIVADGFIETLVQTCKDESISSSEEFLQKCLQFFHIQKSQQAIILNGSPGVGKTTLWNATLKTMNKMDGLENIVYVIDTKTLEKDDLYGKMNKATLEWKDGIFTNILRNVNNDLVGTFKKNRIWIVLDSDLDPEYIEALNSALDDNKLMTLPTGERIPLCHNVHLIFEAPNLKNATPATITRCAILWLAEPVYSVFEQFDCLLGKKLDETLVRPGISIKVIERIRLSLREFLSAPGFSELVNRASSLQHIMGFQSCRVVPAIVNMLIYSLEKYHMALASANEEQITKFVSIKLYQILNYALGSDTHYGDQKTISHYIRILLEQSSLLSSDFYIPNDVEISLQTLEIVDLASSILNPKIEPHEVMRPNVLVPTLEASKQENLILHLLCSGQPFILCGPPGSGKTMLLNTVLQSSLKHQLVGMNFSKNTTVSHIMRALHRHTIYATGPKGLVLCPKEATKEIVLFCDEINLPKLDKYGSQSIILFLRLLIEKKGFWRAEDNKWISIERIHFVGACNPTTDPGRLPMTQRFLRHVTILLIDYPTQLSLSSIYKTFYEATFGLIPQYKEHARLFCEASIHLYYQCKKAFTSNMQAHYIFSPRELTRWIRGFYVAVSTGPQQSLPSLLRIWSYEAWRIFADRLVGHSEKSMFQGILNITFTQFFPSQDSLSHNTSSLLFSSWLSLDYKEVGRLELQEFVKQRFASFCEEEIETQMIIYEDMLDHILRIDRILKQVQGHAMLIGDSRTGKTTMTKFVAWLNGLTVIQPNIHRNYGILEFDDFLRRLLLKCTIDEERVCLIIDESNILETSFLERMNTLLANCDIPDLFQEEQYESLLVSLRQKIQSLGLLLDSEQELYDWFIQQISKNLHVVFTICDPYNSKGSKMITSPALFNRCVINWMGTWSDLTLTQVSTEIIHTVPIELRNQEKSAGKYDLQPKRFFKTDQEVVVSAFLRFHKKMRERNSYKNRSPGIFLDTLMSFRTLHEHKRQELDNSQRFFANGLEKLNESVLKFREMNKVLAEKEKELRGKEKEARETLDKMLNEQNQAERKQEATLEIRSILAKREEEAVLRRRLIVSDLKAFEPIMIEAQRGVKNIKKQQLIEIKSMINPPSAVKITLEAVSLILGQKCSSWREIQHFIRTDEFIFDIVHFDTDSMLSREMKSFIESEYLSRSDYTHETVYRASKACAPLYQWVYAQVKYGEVLDKIGPLREEAKKIEDEALQTKARLLAAEEMITDLEKSIDRTKNNYSRIIRDIELTKRDMAEVLLKLDRSSSLVENLSAERLRWVQNIEQFKQNSSESCGNCLISAVYFNYFGLLNEKERRSTFDLLKSILDDLSIAYDKNYNFVSQNSVTKTQLEWIAGGLPNEIFYLENFVLTLSPETIPYIIDPGSQILPVLSNHLGGKLKIMSFLEHGFVKKFVNAVKFGGIVLIKDAEFFDPVISNIVAHVFKRSRGRRTVEIGDLEIDPSPEFRLFLHSVNAKGNLSRFLKSRVRLINFSTSKASIEMQAVRMALVHDAPEIQVEREELFKLNGSYKVLLTSLEHDLLEGLNDSKGNILENDDLMSTLERLKLEATEVEQKIAGTQRLMEKVNKFSESYSILGLNCSMLYAVLQKFSRLHWFYELPMWLFLKCLRDVFTYPRKVQSGVKSRVEELTLQLYQNVYATFSAYLGENHKIQLALVLYLMRHFGNDVKKLKNASQVILNNVRGDMKEFRKDDENPEKYSLKILDGFEILVQQRAYISALKSFGDLFSSENTLENMVQSNLSNNILIGSRGEVDCSFKVLQLATTYSREVSVVALGSLESTNYAEEEIARSLKEGGCVLLQNLQMSMDWVRSFLKRIIEQQSLDKFSLKKDFRLFMTCDLSGETLPVPILQQSFKQVYEVTPSILDTVKELWKDSSTDSSLAGSMFTAFKFLLAWFHALLVGRARLAPIGFTKKYDFNDCDFNSGLKYFEVLLASCEQKKTPFICDQINYSIGKIIYGGKVDEDQDIAILQTVCSQIFSSRVFGWLSITEQPLELLPGVLIPGQSLDAKKLSNFLNELTEPTESYCLWLNIPSDAIKEYEYITAHEIASQACELLQ